MDSDADPQQAPAELGVVRVGAGAMPRSLPLAIAVATVAVVVALAGVALLDGDWGLGSAFDVWTVVAIAVATGLIYSIMVAEDRARKRAVAAAAIPSRRSGPGRGGGPAPDLAAAGRPRGAGRGVVRRIVLALAFSAAVVVFALGAIALANGDSVTDAVAGFWTPLSTVVLAPALFLFLTLEDRAKRRAERTVVRHDAG